jgi:hypothetical protein
MPRAKKQQDRKSRNGTFGSEDEREERSEIFVTKSIEKGPRVVSETEDRSLLAVHRFVTEPAKVGLELGLTVNLDHFEFARINVRVSMPCYKEEIDDTYRYAQSWAKSRLQLEVNKVREQYPAKDTSGETAKEVEHPF